MDRPQLLEMAHRNSAPSVDIGRFAMVFGDWDFAPIYSGGDVIGVLMSMRNEIHMVIDVPYQRRRSNWREGLKDMVQPLIDKYGKVTTVVQNSDNTAARFIRRIGFFPTLIGKDATMYSMTTIKLKKRGATCPQSQP